MGVENYLGLVGLDVLEGDLQDYLVLGGIDQVHQFLPRLVIYENGGDVDLVPVPIVLHDDPSLVLLVVHDDRHLCPKLLRVYGLSHKRALAPGNEQE